MEKTLEMIAGHVWGIPLIVLLVGTGILLSIALRFIQIVRYPLSVKIISGVYDDPRETGEVSHFRALTSALSGTIGLGNIAGVAVAISLGGPGALFWMWVTALFGMATKYSTCLLSNKFRTVHADGSVSGGPMYTIENGLGRRFRPLAWAFASFAILASLGMANLFQANQMADALYQNFSVPTWLTGAGIVVFVGLVIVGGIRRIGAVTGLLVPVMCIAYIVASLAILTLNAAAVPGALRLIFESAFRGIEPAAGGIGGISFGMVLQWGVRRGVFSNESGLGSAPIAHAAAKTREPVREGLVAMMGPFIDTIVICTMTALVIITTGGWEMGAPPKIAATAVEPLLDASWTPAVSIHALKDDPEHYRGEALELGGEVLALIEQPFKVRVAVRMRPEIHESFFAECAHDAPLAAELRALEPGDRVRVDGAWDGETIDGAALTIFCFRRAIGSWGAYLVVLAICLFALSTAIAWSYYGDRCTMYLVGRGGVLPYRAVFCIVLFIGAIYELKPVVSLCDIANGLMAIPNLFATLALLPVILRATRNYFDREMGR
ncbi:MAG: sodium:alanine symporter family protein [Planctomycetes bacterium]|nr:sodium:alanine symporter family protein [Planctomycetota bacterium]